AFGARYTLGLDGIALVLVVLTALLVPLLMIAGWHDGGERKLAAHTHVALTLAAEATVLVCLVALDLLLFYAFFETMLIPLYFLIGAFGGLHRSQAALKFLVYSLAGGLAMFAALIGLYGVTSAHGHPTFDLQQLLTLAPQADPRLSRAMFLGFL